MDFLEIFCLVQLGFHVCEGLDEMRVLEEERGREMGFCGQWMTTRESTVVSIYARGHGCLQACSLSLPPFLLLHKAI